MCVSFYVLSNGRICPGVVLSAMHHFQAVSSIFLNHVHSVHETVVKRLIVLQPRHLDLVRTFLNCHFEDGVLTRWESKVILREEFVRNFQPRNLFFAISKCQKSNFIQFLRFHPYDFLITHRSVLLAQCVVYVSVSRSICTSTK